MTPQGSPDHSPADAPPQVNGNQVDTPQKPESDFMNLKREMGLNTDEMKDAEENGNEEKRRVRTRLEISQ